MAVDWGYYDKFDRVMKEYLPDMGEGETMATQVVTAVNKLVFKWYNDGDVFDNVNSPMTGWCNDLSSYANWLNKYIPAAGGILEGILDCYNGDEYEDLLQVLADALLDMEDLEALNKAPAVGSIYDCEGPYSFDDHWDIEDDEEDW